MTFFLTSNSQIRNKTLIIALKGGKPMRKQLKCPFCNHRVIDADDTVESEIRVCKSNESWKADYYTKCWSCKKEIGLKKLNRSKN